jgi:catalase
VAQHQEAEGALLEIIAPHVGGVEASDGSWIDAAQQLQGGSSVLYDAVALIPSTDGVEVWGQEPTAREAGVRHVARQEI